MVMKTMNVFRESIFSVSKALELKPVGLREKTKARFTRPNCTKEPEIQIPRDLITQIKEINSALIEKGLNLKLGFELEFCIRKDDKKQFIGKENLEKLTSAFEKEFTCFEKFGVENFSSELIKDNQYEISFFNDDKTNDFLEDLTDLQKRLIKITQDTLGQEYSLDFSAVIKEDRCLSNGIHLNTSLTKDGHNLLETNPKLKKCIENEITDMQRDNLAIYINGGDDLLRLKLGPASPSAIFHDNGKPIGSLGIQARAGLISSIATLEMIDLLTNSIPLDSVRALASPAIMVAAAVLPYLDDVVGLNTGAAPSLATRGNDPVSQIFFKKGSTRLEDRLASATMDPLKLVYLNSHAILRAVNKYNAQNT